MKNWLCITNRPQPSRWLSCVAPGLLAGGLLLTGTLPAAGELYTFAPWYIYGGGIGNITWDGSSTSPDNAWLTVAMNLPVVPNQYVSATATGSSDLLQIAPATTYSFTFSARTSGGPAHAVVFAVDGVGVITNTTVYTTSWARYTNSFTTGGPDDLLVGRYLNIQLALMLSGFAYGTTTVTFTNLQLEVATARPTLTLQPSVAGLVRLQWPTNFYWYLPEHTNKLPSPV